jgi:NTP pyrophosphatase (non-canonical NTP hydrolase)
MNLSEIQQEVDAVNRANGWYDLERTFPEGLMLIVSEAAEALEYYRARGSGPFDHASDKLTDTPGIHEELADIVIRCLDEANRQGFDLEAVILAKLAYNRTRGRHHGGKKL